MPNVLGLNNFSLYYTKNEADSREHELTELINVKAPLNNPHFWGDVVGITKSMVGLGNVNNTSDVNKPLSLATSNALAGKADLTGATFTGAVTLQPPAADSNNNTAATTAFVKSRVSELIDNAPAALNTLNELATALNNDSSFATTVATSLSNRYSKLETDALLTTKHNVILDGGLTIAKTSGLQTALDSKLPLAGGTLTGGLTGTTATFSGSVSSGGQVVVTTNDSRLTNNRTPTTGSVVDASVSATAAIAQSKVANLTADLAGKLPLTGGTLTGALVGTTAAFSGAISSGGNNTVTTNDSRLSDSRTPITESVVDSSVATAAAIAQSKIANLTSDLAGKLPLAGGTLTGGLLGTTATFSGAVSSGGNNVVTTNDSRLSDSRAPTAGSVVDASVSATAAIAQSKVANLTTDLASKLPLTGGTLTGALGGTTATFSGAVSSGGNNVVTTNDSRLSDSRAPTAGSVVDSSVATTAAIAQSKIANLTADLAGKLPLAGGTLTGSLAL